MRRHEANFFLLRSKKWEIDKYSCPREVLCIAIENVFSESCNFVEIKDASTFLGYDAPHKPVHGTKEL